MKFKITVLCTSIFLFAGCASTATRTEEVNAKQASPAKSQPHTAIALERMDAQFLYLGAHQALGHKQPVLAVRFYKALLKKRPHEVTPRFELVDLLLSSGRKQELEQSKLLVEALAPEEVEALSADDLAQYQLLYARTLIANGESKQASILLEDLLQQQPERIDVRLLLVRLYGIDKLYKQAHQVLSQGLKINKDLRLQQMQVQLLLQEGKLKQVDKTLSALQKDYPDHEDIVLQRAHLAEKQGNGIQAESLLQAYIDKHETTALQSYDMLAGVYVRQNRLDAALVIYQKMLPLTNYDAGVFMSIGKIYYQQQKFEKAQESFAQAVKQLTPQQGSQPMGEALAIASFYNGASLEASHHAKQAVVQYEKLQPKHGLYLDAQLRLASIEIAADKFKAADQRLLQLKSTFSHDLSLYETLSSLRLQQQRYQDLIDESDNALDLGYSYALLFNRAVAFEKLKKFEELDRTLNSILAQQPDDAETLNFYGYSLADREIRLTDAQAMLKRALQIKPHDGYYLDSLAWIYFKKKEFGKALEKQLIAVDIIKRDPVMMEHLGDIYWQNNQTNQARVSWKKAIDLGHEEPDKLKIKIERGLM